MFAHMQLDEFDLLPTCGSGTVTQRWGRVVVLIGRRDPMYTCTLENMINEWFKRAVVPTRSATLAAWNLVHLVFFARRCGDPVPRVAAHWAFGSHVECTARNLPAGGR